MELIQRRTELSQNILGLCRFLRSKGMTIGPGEVKDALEGLTQIDFSSKKQLRWVLRTILAKSHAEQLIFDEFYAEYWDQLEKGVDSKIKEGDPKNHSSPQNNKPAPQPSLQSLKDWLYGNREEEEEEMASYSASTVITQKDFSAFTDDELQEVMHLIAVIAKKLARQKQRRYKQGNKGIFDIRNTVRANLRQGGEWMHLAYKLRKERRLKLLLICDVSKSMDLYSQFLVQFLYGFQQVFRHIETFVFSTHLYRITEQLQWGAFREAWLRIAEEVPDWSGGTRIGASLDELIHRHRGMLNRRTVVLIMSDGWDTGDTELLEASMEEIHKQVARVIWLNPLAGNPDYEPSVKGMQVAMPYIDVFAPAHNIESLKKVVNLL